MIILVPCLTLNQQRGHLRFEWRDKTLCYSRIYRDMAQETYAEIELCRECQTKARHMKHKVEYALTGEFANAR